MYGVYKVSGCEALFVEPLCHFVASPEFTPLGCRPSPLSGETKSYLPQSLPCKGRWVSFADPEGLFPRRTRLRWASAGPYWGGLKRCAQASPVRGAVSALALTEGFSGGVPLTEGFPTGDIPHNTKKPRSMTNRHTPGRQSKIHAVPPGSAVRKQLSASTKALAHNAATRFRLLLVRRSPEQLRGQYVQCHSHRLTPTADSLRGEPGLFSPHHCLYLFVW